MKIGAGKLITTPSLGKPRIKFCPVLMDKIGYRLGIPYYFLKPISKRNKYIAVILQLAEKSLMGILIKYISTDFRLPIIVQFIIHLRTDIAVIV
jgi:hypothetical protein